jgi:hypothetical protein
MRFKSLSEQRSAARNAPGKTSVDGRVDGENLKTAPRRSFLDAFLSELLSNLIGMVLLPIIGIILACFVCYWIQRH